MLKRPEAQHNGSPGRKACVGEKFDRAPEGRHASLHAALNPTLRKEREGLIG